MIVDRAEDQLKGGIYDGAIISSPDPALRLRRSWSALPAYETSEAYQKHINGSEQKGEERPWFHKRLWRILIMVVVVYALLTTVIAVPILVKKFKDQQSGSDIWFTNSNSFDDQQYLSSGINLVEPTDSMICNIWNTTTIVHGPKPFVTTLHANLPAMGSISILSNNTYNPLSETRINGTLTVNYDASLTTNDIQFFVYMRTTMDLHRLTSVCLTDVGEARGLSIFVPSAPGVDMLDIDIKVVLPKNTSHNPGISNFTTYLPTFTQTFGDLRKVKFQTVNIEGTNEPIHATNLRAPRINIKNIMHDITGTFNASESLSLDTFRGVINASITLVGEPFSQTTLYLDTGDSMINAEVTLVTEMIGTEWQPYYKTPLFVGKVVTFNGPLNFDVKYHKSTPSKIPIRFTVQNNLARTKVIMDPKFQGYFLAQTKLSTATVTLGPESYSSGVDRPLDVLQAASWRTYGWVGNSSWTFLGQSRIEVFSSLSTVELTL